jgi:hypothetical protein
MPLTIFPNRGEGPPALDQRDVDSVNRPAHYTFGAVEVIDAIEAWGLGFHLANVVKYVARSAHKGHEIEDLRKAAWYLARKIDQLKKAAE